MMAFGLTVRLARRGLCNAHHLRELIFLHETLLGQRWPRELIDLLRAANREVNQARAQGATLAPERLRHHYQACYLAWVTEGQGVHPEQVRTSERRERVRQTPAFNLLHRLSRYAENVLRFLTDPRVPFDNNQAERDIRMPKLKQKISGAFRTPHGASATVFSSRYPFVRSGRSIYRGSGTGSIICGMS